jgi:hypothetical protein
MFRDRVTVEEAQFGWWYVLLDDRRTGLFIRSPSRRYLRRVISVQATISSRCLREHERIAADGITQPAS